MENPIKPSTATFLVYTGNIPQSLSLRLVNTIKIIIKEDNKIALQLTPCNIIGEHVQYLKGD